MRAVIQEDSFPGFSALFKPRAVVLQHFFSRNFKKLRAYTDVTIVKLCAYFLQIDQATSKNQSKTSSFK